MTLGFEDSFVVTWRDKQGQDRITSSGVPDELSNFLYARNDHGRSIRNIPATRCILGPHNASFFVHDSSAYLWMNIPDGLLSALQARIRNGSWIDRPRIVALGADENFVMITEKNKVIWDLENYKTLSNFLESSRTRDRATQDITNITLHPYRYGCFIAHSQSGTLLFENLPQHQVPGLQRMLDPLRKDTELANHRELQRKESPAREPLQRKSSALQERARVRREWTDHRQQFTAQSKGLKLSVSFSIGGLARMLG